MRQNGPEWGLKVLQGVTGISNFWLGHGTG
jgi:hypothetical protein